jgi:Protein of unknown function (DUF2934)
VPDQKTRWVQSSRGVRINKYGPTPVLKSNIKMHMNDREQQVRERAYYMWEAEGRPHGRAEIHWVMAEIATAVLSYLSLLEAERTAGMRAGNHDNGWGRLR